MWTTASKILVQGITESFGLECTARMQAYGSNIIAGVSAGQGDREVQEIPIFDLVETAIDRVGEIDISVIFAPPYEVLDAALEAIAARIKQLVIVTPRVPPLDLFRLIDKAKATGTLILGAGSAGLIAPETICVGSLDPGFYRSGNIGLISYGDRLNYEVALQLNRAGLGQSLVVTLGDESVNCSSFERWLEILETDEKTAAIVLIWQTNRSIEPALIEKIKTQMSKPVIIYVAGVEVPMARHLTDAASIIAHQLSYSIPALDRHKQLVTAIEKANLPLAKRLSQIPELLQQGNG
jgi:succinyl-CoA synthetase alpha subunit